EVPGRREATDRPAIAECAGTLRNRILDVLLDLLSRLIEVERTDRCFRVEGAAESLSFGARNQCVDERFLGAALDENPLGCGASLPGGVEGTCRDARGGCLKVCIREDDRWSVATQFEDLASHSTQGGDLGSALGRAGKADGSESGRASESGTRG